MSVTNEMIKQRLSVALGMGDGGNKSNWVSKGQTYKRCLLYLRYNFQNVANTFTHLFNVKRYVVAGFKI